MVPGRWLLGGAERPDPHACFGDRVWVGAGLPEVTELDTSNKKKGPAELSGSSVRLYGCSAVTRGKAREHSGTSGGGAESPGAAE